MTGDLAEAIRLDLAQQIEPAAARYEGIIAESNAPIEAFLNLAFVYWQSTDYGFHSVRGLSAAFVERAARRYLQVLEDAHRRFPNDKETVFWKLYFDYMTLGASPLTDFCDEVSREEDAPDVIYLHLFSERRKEKYLPHLHGLLRTSEQSLTTKNRYVASVIRSLIGSQGND